MDWIYFLRNGIHYGAHFGIPILVANLFFKSSWKKTSLILLATMFVDLDHLLATPIFDAHRCSVGFHFFHSYPAIMVYIVMFCIKETKVVAIGLLLHMLTDIQDCFWN